MKENLKPCVYKLWKQMLLLRVAFCLEFVRDDCSQSEMTNYKQKSKVEYSTLPIMSMSEANANEGVTHNRRQL